jgi:hypothetical protein
LGLSVRTDVHFDVKSLRRGVDSVDVSQRRSKTVADGTVIAVVPC